MYELRITLGVILTLTLIGCSDTTQSTSESPTFPLNREQASVKKNYTEDDAIAIFKEDKDYSKYEISDYVIVNDDKFPMLKAVISFYDHIENNSCNLAFFTEM